MATHNGYFESRYDQRGYMTRSDMRILIRAARQHWPTPTEKRRQAVRRVQQILDDPETTNVHRATALQTMSVFKAAGWMEATD